MNNYTRAIRRLEANPPKCPQCKRDMDIEHDSALRAFEFSCPPCMGAFELAHPELENSPMREVAHRLQEMGIYVVRTWAELAREGKAAP